MFYSRMKPITAYTPVEETTPLNDVVITHKLDHETKAYIVENTQAASETNGVAALVYQYVAYTDDSTLKINWQLRDNSKIYNIDSCLPCRAGYYLTLSLLDGKNE